MTSEVGSGQVAIFPTFKGFRRAVSAEVDGSAKESGSRFASGFRTVGSQAGRSFGSSFKSATGSLSSDALRSATAGVAKSSRELATLRLRELDAVGKVRIAEASLSDARSRYASDSQQVIRAEERLATAQRTEVSVQGRVRESTEQLAASKRELAVATNTAAASGSRISSVFGGLPKVFGNAGSASGSKFRSEFIGVLGGVVGGNILTGIGFTIGHLINNGIQTGLGVGLQAVQFASDLNETKSAVKQVFGTAADDIIAFTKTANRSLGQTQQSALVGAQTFGIFAKSAGLSGQPLTAFSTKLVTLAGDLASFYNTSPADAVEALSAGLRGESEPLRRYGILLDDQTLRAKALALGIYDGTGALTQQQRILAAQSVIMQQSSIAQGDFARTSDGLANQQRILQASLQDTQTQLGTFFLPGFTKVVTYANSTFLPKVGEMVDRIGPKLAAAFQSSAPQAKALLDKVGPLVDKLADGGASAIPDFIGGMGDFVAAAPGWIDAFKQVNDAGNHFADFLDTIGVTSNKPQQAIEKGVGDFFAGIGPAIKTALPGGLFGAGELNTAGKNAAGDWFDGMAAAAGEKDNNDKLLALGTGSASAWFDGMAAAAGDPAAIKKVKDAGGTVGVNYVAGFATTASPQAATDKGFGFANGFGLGLIGQVPAVGTNGTFLGQAAVNGVDSLRGEFATSGELFAQGLINGMNSKLPLVDATGASLGHAVSRATRRAMVLGSPSRLAHSYGQFWGDGLANGMDARQSKVQSSAAALARIPSYATAGASVASAPSASSSYSGPSTLVIVDADGHLIGRMQIEADARVQSKFDQVKAEDLAGGTIR